MADSLFDIIDKNKFSYADIRNKSIVTLLDDKEYTINVIIGFRGRKEFWNAIKESFEKAFKYYTDKFPDKGYTFCLTMVEHSAKDEAKEFFEGKSNYMWTPGNVVEQYSRSFVYNFGVKYGNKAKYYILHDLDIVVRSNFFEELFENLDKNPDCQAMQTYGGRHIWYLSKELTSKVLSGEIDYNKFNETTSGITPPAILGSKGGSILVGHDLYYKIGGFDANLFWGYAIEDQFFYLKMLTAYSDVVYADEPKIAMYHLNHPPAIYTNPMLYEMEKYFHQLQGMTKKDRIKLIEIQHKNFIE